MCGIGGWLGHMNSDPALPERIARSLHHRGPDSSGIQCWHRATFVHTRLSIIDLSPLGHQPMSNEDGRIWTIFNGEIYNHHALRADLERRGHKFRGHSDTEVLPHLYEEYGSGFVSQLRGMFAFAIIDLETSTLLLARDRFGIKPLFFAQTLAWLGFASEINALLHLPGIDTTPNAQAIYDYAALLYIPAPQTFYRGIQALMPGQTLVAEMRGDTITQSTHSYKQWEIRWQSPASFDDTVNRADDHVRAAVGSQIESDVPLGSMLSGGIDSSLVSAAAQSIIPGDLKTFSVSFPEQTYDESPFAQLVAAHIGSDHHVLSMPPQAGTWELITSLLHHAGQPYADTSLFAVSGICRLMRQYVTVALSGDGGDEAFAGYKYFRRALQLQRLRRIPVLGLPSTWSAAQVPLQWAARVSSRMRRIAYSAGEMSEGTDLTGILQTMLSWIRPNELRALWCGPSVQPLRRWFEPQWDYQLSRHIPIEDEVMAQSTEIAIRLILPNDFLFKVDTASMAHSLEVRVPMLDEDLVEFGISLPYHKKIQGKQGKRVLRSLAARWLPPSVANKPKQGFAIPVDRWVDGAFRQQLKDTLDDRSPVANFFHPEVYRQWLDAFCDGGKNSLLISREGLYQRVIMLLSLHLALTRTAVSQVA